MPVRSFGLGEAPGDSRFPSAHGAARVDEVSCRESKCRQLAHTDRRRLVEPKQELIEGSRNTINGTCVR